MCYRCEVCRTVTPAGTGRLTHVVYRTTRKQERYQVERELAVCPSCKAALVDGVSLADLTARHALAPTTNPIRPSHTSKVGSPLKLK